MRVCELYGHVGGDAVDESSVQCPSARFNVTSAGSFNSTFGNPEPITCLYRCALSNSLVPCLCSGYPDLSCQLESCTWLDIMRVTF
jgi:hypothetical protein